MICWFNSRKYVGLSGRHLRRDLTEDEVTFDEMLKIGFTGERAEQVVNAMMSDQPLGLLFGAQEPQYRWALYEILDLFMVADKYDLPELVDETLERVFRIVRNLEYDFVWELVEFIESNHFSKELIMKKLVTFFAECHVHFWNDAKFKAWIGKDSYKGMAECILEELGRLNRTRRRYDWDDWRVDYM